MFKKLKDWWFEFELDYFIVTNHDGEDVSKLRYFIKWTWNWFRSRYVDGWVCKRKGHKWVDDSYGGPDSGCMAGHCERCGYSFHTQLY